MPVTHKGLPVTPTHKGATVQAWHKGVLVTEPDTPTEYETPTFVQVTPQSVSGNTPARTITGTAGNTLVAVMRANTSEGGAVPTITTPGWTAIAAYEGGQGVSTCIAVKEATGAAETVQGSFVAGTSGRMVVLEFFGVDIAKAVAGPVTTVDPGTSVTTLTASGLVVAEPSLLLGLFASSGSSGTVTTDPAITMHWDNTVGSRLVQPGTYDQTWSWDTGRRARVALVALAAKGGDSPPDPEPEPEFIAVASADATVSTTSHPVTIPAAVAEGDLLVLTAASTDATIALSVPGGWTERYNGTTPGGVGAMWTKAATAADAAGGTVAVATSIAARCAAVLTVYRDLSIEEAVMDGGSDYAMPSVTAAADDWAILAWLAKSGDLLDINPPVGVTKRHSFSGTGVGHLNTLHGDVADLPDGPTPAYTASPAGGTSNNIFTGIVRARPSLTGNDEEPPPPPPGGEVVFGGTLVGNVAGTRAWEQEIGLPGTGGGTATPSNVGPIGCIRLFPGQSNNTEVANTVLNARPGGLGPQTIVALSCKFTESDASAATMTTYLQTVQTIAEKATPGTKFYMALDAEYDRRPWVAQFPAKLQEFRALQLVHAPSLTMVLNPSGYLFAQRIGQVWPAVQGYFDVLAPSLYVYGGASAQNGSYSEFTEAHDFAAANNLRFATYEYGVSKTVAGATVVSETQMNLTGYVPNDHIAHIEESVNFLTAFSNPHVEIAPYFEASVWATVIGDTRIGTSSGAPASVAQSFGDAIEAAYA